MSLRVRSGTVALLLLAGAASACRFERRPDVDQADGADADEPYSAAVGVVAAPAEDSVRALVAAVNDAFAVGDGARLAQLTTRDAVLVDTQEGVLWTHDRGDRIPVPLTDPARTGEWTLTEASFSLLAEGVALVSCRFGTSATGGDPARMAVETWVTVRTADGWRVRHLHRSRGAGEGAPVP